MSDVIDKPVMFVTQWFDPEPAMRGGRFVTEISKQLGNVRVVTGFPNYPSGAVYPGYKIKPWQREQHDGYSVLRLPLYPSHDNRAIHRVANYISFAMSVFFYCLFGLRHVRAVYIYHPPLTVGLAVAAANLIHRKPIVLDIQDLWPDTLSATGMINHPGALKFIGKTCDWLYRRVAHIVVLSPGFKKALTGRGVSSHKITHVYNWAPDEGAQDGSDTPDPVYTLPKDKFNIVYAGNMGPAQGLLDLVPALVQIQDSSPKVMFTFVGTGLSTQALQHATIGAGLTNVVFHPPVPQSKIGAVLDQADALFLSLNKDSLFDITIPSKLMSYLGKGKPILAALSGDARNLVEQAKVGYVVAPADAQALALEIEKLFQTSPEDLKQMGKNGQNFYDKNLSMQSGAKHIVEIITNS